MKGITIKLYSRTQTGVDGFNQPVYEWDYEEVENVLVAPVSGTEIFDDQDMEGRRAEYQLAIPKGDDHVWENQQVEFFGERWIVIGKTTIGIDGLIPLDWNRKVTVARYE